MKQTIKNATFYFHLNFTYCEMFKYSPGDTIHEMIMVEIAITIIFMIVRINNNPL